MIEDFDEKIYDVVKRVESELQIECNEREFFNGVMACVRGLTEASYIEELRYLDRGSRDKLFELIMPFMDNKTESYIEGVYMYVTVYLLSTKTLKEPVERKTYAKVLLNAACNSVNLMREGVNHKEAHKCSF